MWAFRLRHEDMIGPAARQWPHLTAEDKELLAYAFDYAMRNPHQVGDLTINFLKLHSGKYANVWKFRFGFTSFIVVDLEERILVYDLEIDQRLYMAAE